MPSKMNRREKDSRKNEENIERMKKESHDGCSLDKISDLVYYYPVIWKSFYLDNQIVNVFVLIQRTYVHNDALLS